jgi:hypothetical protein
MKRLSMSLLSCAILAGIGGTAMSTGTDTSPPPNPPCTLSGGHDSCPQTGPTACTAGDQGVRVTVGPSHSSCWLHVISGGTAVYHLALADWGGSYPDRHSACDKTGLAVNVMIQGATRLFYCNAPVAATSVAATYQTNPGDCRTPSASLALGSSGPKL